jgi:cell division protein FtsX
MKRTKKMDWAKHAAVLSITVLVFFTGILLGTLLNKNKLDNVKEISEELRISTMSSEVEFAILAENPCTIEDLGFLSDDLHELS